MAVQMSLVDNKTEEYHLGLSTDTDQRPLSDTEL